MQLILSRRGKLRHWALFALALFVFDALGPALAALSGAQPRSHFVEICGSEGIKRVVAADLSEDGKGSNEAGFKCPLCPACSAHAGQAEIDAPRLPLHADEDASRVSPCSATCVRMRSRVRAIAPPRGPPHHP